MYAILLLLTTVVCCIMLAPGLQDSLASVPFCRSHKSSLDSFGENVDEFGQQLGVGSLGISSSPIEVEQLQATCHNLLI